MKSILIADDNQSVLELTCLFAEINGLKPLGVNSGKEVYGLADKVDMYLLDCDMECEGIGVQVGKELRELYPSKPIMMMSGRMTPDRIEQIKEYTSDYLKKPFHLEEITEMMKKYI